MRTSFNSSGLVRFLADLDIGESADAKQTIAERLSQWMGWTDAISLSAALAGSRESSHLGGNPGRHPVSEAADARGHARATRSQPRTAAGHADHAAVAEARRVRDELARAITDDAALSMDDGSGTVRTPWRQAYQARQRAMETRIGALRANVRAALAGQSHELARLASLDAVLERTLAPRERQLLGTVPGLLERHTERQHRQDTAVGARAGHAASGPDRPSLQTALLAELDIRLQPIEGMLEALDPQATRST